MRITWLLQNELALGTAPRTLDDLDRLEREGVRAVLSVCAAEEAPLPDQLPERFSWSRLPLPDHRYGRPPAVQELQQVVTELGVLQRHGPVFLHCVAGVERSPLVAMAWLVKRHGLGWQAALEYVQQCHPGTSPLPEQLASLRRCRWLPLSTPEPLATIPAVA